ncbi:PREDICTED: eukaryotic translation initiation factor 3 subunit A-like [Priapulus caudatus]|uniref:Eukaryotic translation initiation factor 3 subunit A-like n=1 Tax=Priapulus caudatus TaxID=37621 RepID=A0ABM1DUK5_PRICU|nr:PREDICTED: eukaryotic translation initiation factor 3 subunit A-like [Priapulus caudatus]
MEAIGMFGKTAQFAGKVSQLNNVLGMDNHKDDSSIMSKEADEEEPMSRKEKKKLEKQKLEEQRKLEEMRLKKEEERNKRQSVRAQMRNQIREKYNLKESEKDLYLAKRASAPPQVAIPESATVVTKVESKYKVVTPPTMAPAEHHTVPEQEATQGTNSKKDCVVM